jgi:hypothetical protein
MRVYYFISGRLFSKLFLPLRNAIYNAVVTGTHVD